MALARVARAAVGSAALAAAITAAIALSTPTHAQTVGCVWTRVEPARMITSPVLNANNSRYNRITTVNGKIPHPFLTVTGSGNVAGRTVTARIRVVNLRGRIGSLMRSGTAPALSHEGYSYANTFVGNSRDWVRGNLAIIRWDGPDLLWEWVFTGAPTATAGDHGFTLDAWWQIAFFTPQGYDFAPSTYYKTYSWANAIEYTCTVN